MADENKSGLRIEVECPACESEFDIEHDPAEPAIAVGDRFDCDHCGAELEVEDVDPIVLTDDFDEDDLNDGSDDDSEDGEEDDDDEDGDDGDDGD